MINEDFATLGHARRRRILFDEQGGACNHCKLTTWMGKPIPLELEHKDGDRTNNSRKNLELICPNCHSLTPTWRGRNKTTESTTEAQFLSALATTPNIRQALLKLGLAGAKNYKRAYRLKARLQGRYVS